MINYLRNEQITLPAYCADYLWHMNLHDAAQKLQKNTAELHCHDHRFHKSSGLSPEQEAQTQTAFAIKDFRQHISRDPRPLEQLCLQIHFSEMSLIGIYVGNKYQQATEVIAAYNG
ncbi:MAG: hypothetical protein V7739_12930 [Motiliproteus sp.]